MLGRRNQRGDTIVEVLIAMTVIATVLGGAFVASRRAQVGSQRNDERSYANKLLESQIEHITIAASDELHEIQTMSGGDEWCFVEGAPVDANNRLVASHSRCTGVNSLFDVYFERQTDPFTYGIHVEWDRLGGDDSGVTERESVDAYYRVPPK